MAVGSPERVIEEIVRQAKHELTVIANDTAMPGHEREFAALHLLTQSAI